MAGAEGLGSTWRAEALHGRHGRNGAARNPNRKENTMPHYRELMEPTEYFGKPKLMSFNQVDEQGQHDTTYRIIDVKAGEVVDQKNGGKKIKKPVLLLKDAKSKEWSFPVGATVCKVIEKLYGTGDVRAWVGKLVTLFVTTTSVGGEDVYCLRVRPQIPQPKGKSSATPNDRIEPPEQPRTREPGEDG